MKMKINLWAFIFSFICIALFFTVISSAQLVAFIFKLIHIHPLSILLIISLITFLFGLIGLSAATHWKALVRGVLTVVISFILFAIITYIITMANLFEFT